MYPQKLVAMEVGVAAIAISCKYIIFVLCYFLCVVGICYLTGQTQIPLSWLRWWSI